MMTTRTLAIWVLFGSFAISTIVHAGSRETVSVSLMPFFSSAPVFIALERGYFSAEMLEVKLDYSGSAQNVAIAVSAGQADFGVTGLTAGFFNLAGKGSLKIIAGQYQEKHNWPGSAYLACNDAFDKGLNSPRLLSGKKVAITQPGSTFHRWFGALADAQHQSFDSYQLVPLQTVPAMISALSTCQVDGMIMLPQVAYKLEKAGKAHIIGQVSDHTPGQVGALFTSKKQLLHKRDQVRRFLKAYRKAANDYHRILIASDNKQSDEAMQLLQEINRFLSPKLPDDLLAKAVVYIPEDAELDPASMQDTLDWFQKQKLVRPGIKLHDIWIRRNLDFHSGSLSKHTD